jgi:hypothetical protein
MVICVVFGSGGWLRCVVVKCIVVDIELVDGVLCFGVIVRYSTVFLPNPSRIGVSCWWMVF